MDIYANFKRVLIKALKNHKINTTKYDLDKLIHTNPYFPSLMGISYLLKKFGIKNMIVKIPIEELKNIPLPCIIYFGNMFTEFYFMDEIRENSAIVSNGKKRQSIDLNIFTPKWETFVILLDSFDEKLKSVSIDDYTINQNTKILKKILVYTLIVLFPALSIIQYGFLSLFTLITVFSVAGILVSWLILLFEIKLFNPIIQKLCGYDKNNCSSAIESKYSKLFNFKVPHISIVYFFNLFTLNVLKILFPSHTLMIWELSYIILLIMGLPISIYFLIIMIKEKLMCRLCLVSHALIIFQLILLLSIRQNFSPESIILSDIFIYNLSSLTISIVFSILLVTFLTNYKNNIALTKRINLYSYNGNYINSILQQLPYVEIKIVEHEIILGQTSYVSSKKRGILILDPFCEHCGHILDLFVQLASSYPDKFSLLIRFYVSAEQDSINGYFVRQLYLYKLRFGMPIKPLLDWYHSNNFNKWSKRYALKEVHENDFNLVDEVIEHQKKWLYQYDFHSFPIIALNERVLPANFSIEDIKLFLDEAAA